MKSISETGHAKNVANFETLTNFCQGYGAQYNPVKPNLTLTELQNLHTLAKQELDAVTTAKVTFKNATAERKNAFTGLKPLVTRIINSFAISGADKLAVQNAKSINRKLQGNSRARKQETTQEETQELSTKSISTSQQSYDSLISHFANLIEVLVQHPVYNPNEAELKVSALQATLQNLQTANTTMITAYTQYSNAMIERNKALYNPLTGLVRVSREVKQYIKSLFGAQSPQYQQIKGIELKSMRRY